MTFNATIRQFKTPADLTQYLATLSPPDWPGANPIGSTYHNTYSPTEAQWQGKTSMDGMVSYYISKGWTSGPHFYLALHSPNASNDGIWQMTPPTGPGTHAGECNPTRFGIEVVGDFNIKAPSEAQQQLLIDTVACLHRWAKLGAVLNAHRDCMADRTCPGNAFYALKADLTARLQAQLSQPTYRHYTVIAPCAVLTGRSPAAPLASGPDNGQTQLAPGDIVTVGDVTDGWLWCSPNATDPPGIGFIPSSYARLV
jgi:hypothetical protein